MPDLFNEFEQQLARLKTASGAQNDAALAQIMGISSGAITNARRRGTIPKKWFLHIATAFNVHREWLVSGGGAMRRDEFPQQQPPAGSADNPTTTIMQTDSKKKVPVIGLAACGLSDWFNPGPVAVHASVPNDVGPRTFGIIAVGDSMQPQGIEQGFVAVCDPDAVLAVGDVVYIEQHDMSTGNKLASLKKYIKQDDHWVYLKGWLPPDKDGVQKPVVSQLALQVVARIVPVTMVKRKP